MFLASFLVWHPCVCVVDYRSTLILLLGILIELNLGEASNQTFYVPPAQSADNQISQLGDLSLHFES